MSKDTFEILFNDDYFNKGDVITYGDKVNLKVVSKPKRKWYHILLQIITFGRYKASFYHKVRIIK